MLFFPSTQTMVIRMGEIVEACRPPPCLGAICACAGGGFAGTAKPLVRPTCKPFIRPCRNGDALCKQCFGESGCAGGSKSGGGVALCDSFSSLDHVAAVYTVASSFLSQSRPYVDDDLDGLAGRPADRPTPAAALL